MTTNMRIKVRPVASFIISLPMALSAWSVHASAASQRFDCVLTDTADKLGSENRPIVVVLDEAAITLEVQDGGQKYNLNNVSISNISINGDTDRLSLGIDRSSLGIVWQQYGANKMVIEFGKCRQADHPAAAGAQ